MSEIKVSVIMPVYNAASYLDKTLETVCGQTLPEIEIICVDDGSTDNSKDIIEKFAQSDNRVTLLQQQNQYAGVARNNGFERAKGEYVVFWDSDDFFKPEALEIMYNKSKEAEADICLCDAYNYYEEEDKSFLSDEFVKYGVLPEETPFNRNDIPDKIFNLGANVPWNKMFRADFIREKGLKFQNLRQSNDTYFVLMAIFLAEKITYTKERLVYYRKSEEDGSITSKSDKSPLCSFEAYAYLKQELEKIPYFGEENRKSFANRTIRGMLRSLHIQKTQSGFDAVRERLIDGGFEELGLNNGPEYFEAMWLYEDMQSILSNTGTEHMIYKYNSAKKAKEKFKSKSISLSEKVIKKDNALEKTKAANEKLKGKIDSLEAKNAENKQKLAENKKELVENKKRIAKLEKELDKKNNQLTNLRRKWYVRLFSKIERIIKRIRGK